MGLGLAACQSIIAARDGTPFQRAQYHQSSEFDRAMTDMNISDRKASVSTSKLGWTSC